MLYYSHKIIDHLLIIIFSLSFSLLFFVALLPVLHCKVTLGFVCVFSVGKSYFSA